MMIEKGKAALIIDHDLMFIDYLSKKLLVFEGIPARLGKTEGPYPMEKGMNTFLKGLDITFRRDEESNRPRINKQDSQKDKEQKASGQLYYTK
jgi:ATP-binding cassette subfamily E protein 1